MKTDYRVNDKLIRKSLGKELPDLTISPTIKMAIMEHVNNKKSHSMSLILVWMGIAASLLLAFFLGRTSSIENNPATITAQKMVKKEKNPGFHGKDNDVHPKYSQKAKAPLRNNPPNNLSLSISSPGQSQSVGGPSKAFDNPIVIYDTIYIDVHPERSFDSIYLAMAENMDKLEMEFQDARSFQKEHNLDINPQHPSEKQCDSLFFDSLKQEIEIFEQEFRDVHQTMFY